MESQKRRFEASFLPYLRTFLSLSCALWPPRVLRIAPDDRLQQITHLRRAQPHHTAHRRRPDKTATVQPLRVERQSNSIVPQGLDQRTAASAEHDGSRPRLSCTNNDKPCMPLRMSVWPVAIQIRAFEEIGIIDAPEPAAPAPALPHRRWRRQSLDDPCQSRSPSAHSAVWEQPPARPQRPGRPAQSQIVRFEG